MWRAVASLIGLVSFATILAEGIAIGYMAARGQLTSETIAAISAALSGKTPEAAAPAAPSAVPLRPSAEQVESARTLHTLELNARADDLRLLKDLLSAEAERLRKERSAYEQARAEFEARLADVRARSTDDATEQTRLVVKVMPAREAVAYLLPLPEADALRILRGLPERSTAKILQEFAAGADEERQRGRILFEALSDGEPETGLTDAARSALPNPPGSRVGG